MLLLLFLKPEKLKTMKKLVTILLAPIDQPQYAIHLTSCHVAAADLNFNFKRSFFSALAHAETVYNTYWFTNSFRALVPHATESIYDSVNDKKTIVFAVG